MKNGMSYVYLFIGLFIGFIVGSAPQGAAGFALHRLVIFVIAIVLILLYIWFENTSHVRHMSKWESHQRRGKTYFVISHYIIARAIPIVVILIAPLGSEVKFTGDAILVLIFTAFVALAAFIALGLREWSGCQTDFSVRLLRREAERLREAGAGVAGSNE